MIGACFRMLFWLVVAMVLLSLAVGQAHAQPPTYLPWQPGVAYRVTQGNNQWPSHDTAYTRYGWDFALPGGTQVLAAAPGRVTSAGWDSTGWGKTVVVCYGDGTCSRYAHLSRIAVGGGQSVGQAQLVGWSGSTGNSSGPHLHYQLQSARGGYSLASRFVEAGVPRTGMTVVSRNVADPTPQFDDVHIFSSDHLAVGAGGRVTAVVTAHYEGPRSIPCQSINLGVRGDATARFADYRSGYWPTSVWRSPNRTAAVGCIGSLDPGEYARWDLAFYVPQSTPGGDYLTGVYAPVWDGTAWSGLALPIFLRVGSAYHARLVDESVTPLVGPGTTGHLSVALENTGRAVWHRGEVNLGTAGDERFPFADATWHGNANRVVLSEETVAPGEVGHFEADFAVPPGTPPTRRKQYFAPVVEGNQWFAQDLGIYLMIMVGDRDHQPFAASDYGAGWVTQTYLAGPLDRGSPAAVSVTYRNTGWATWFRDGPHPVDLRGIRPQDRQSGFIDPGSPETVGGQQGVRLPVTSVAPGQTVTFTLPLKVDPSVPPGTFHEYFRPVAEGLTWFGPDDVWWPFTVN